MPTRIERVVLIGPVGSGKTELCLRVIGITGSSKESTTYYNLYATKGKSPLSSLNENGEFEEEEFLINKQETIIQLFDPAGQMESNELLQLIDKATKGVIFVVDSTKDINYDFYYEFLDKFLSNKDINYSIYVSKIIKEESNINFEKILDGDLTSLDSYIKFKNEISSRVNAVNNMRIPLIIGDAVGYDEEDIEPIAYIYLKKGEIKEIPFNSIPTTPLIKYGVPKKFYKSL